LIKRAAGLLAHCGAPNSDSPVADFPSTSFMSIC